MFRKPFISLTGPDSHDTIVNGVAKRGRRLADPSKGGEAMSVFEAVTLMLAFAALIIMLLDYLNRK